MSLAGRFKKQTMVVICSVVLISLLVVGVSYSKLGNIGEVSDNVVVNNYPITATFKENNVIKEELPVLSNEDGLKTASKIFSVLNESESNVKYTIGIRLLDDNKVSPSNFMFNLDDEDTKSLSSCTSNNGLYIIDNDILRYKNNVSDTRTHYIRVWAKGGNDTLASYEIVINGEEVNNIFADTITSLANKNSNDLYIDSYGTVRYYGSEAKNYVKFSDELWRVVGVFNTKTKEGRDELRIKIVRNESIGSSPFIKSNNYSWDSNIGEVLGDYESNEKNELLSSYLNEKYTKLIDVSEFYIGSLQYDSIKSAADVYNNEISAYDNFGRNNKLTTNVGLLSASDYYFASKDLTTGNYLSDGTDYWLMNNNYDNTNKAFYVDAEGSLLEDSSINSHNIRPVVYLKSTITNISGDGSLENPYIIE